MDGGPRDLVFMYADSRESHDVQFVTLSRSAQQLRAAET